MGPYSHYFLAAKLAPILKPGDPAAYHWGAIVPDIRYLAKIPRTDTHLEQDRIREMAARYPHLSSFLLGYQVHCLIDEIDVIEVVGKAFPLNVFQWAARNKLSLPQVTMLVEMYFLQRPPVGGTLSGGCNEALADLGITLEQASAYYEAMQAYLQSRSMASGAAAFQKIGMNREGTVEKYRRAYEAAQRSRVMKPVLLSSVQNARLEAHTLNHVQARLRAF